MASETLAEFMARFDPDGTRTVATVDAVRDSDGNSPFIVARHGEFTAVLVPMPFGNHLCIDVHSFAGGQDAAAGVFGMTEGRVVSFPETGSPHQLKSHGWPAARGISVILGRQEGRDDPDAQAATARQLREALAHIDSEGFGDDVDSDSLIEHAARAYLAAITR